jgi:hypothetical protein
MLASAIRRITLALMRPIRWVTRLLEGVDERRSAFYHERVRPGCQTQHSTPPMPGFR